MCLVRVHHLLAVRGEVWREVRGAAVAAQRLCGGGAGKQRLVGRYAVCAAQHCHQACEADVAIGKEHGIVGAVETLCERHGVGCGVGAQLLCVAQYAMSECATRKHCVLPFVIYQLRWRVVVALYLVAYHLHLFVYLCLWVCAVKHDVGQQVYGACRVVV